MRLQDSINGLLLLAGSSTAMHYQRQSDSLLTVVQSTFSAATPSSTASSGPNCGKGYTYCGYMLQSGGHNFAPDTIKKAYCDGAKCDNGVNKTDISQAVFLCMDSFPASIQLMCACSDRCLNEKQSNNIAHCESSCVNGQKCL